MYYTSCVCTILICLCHKAVRLTSRNLQMPVARHLCGTWRVKKPLTQTAYSRRVICSFKFYFNVSKF